jgi:(1->4)-alpha-D-glucan 1-alpha-D-glucosylmutase
MALREYIAKLLSPSNSEFLKSFGAFAARTNLIGALNGLSQLALKALLPGVPDFYQGTETWDFSFVDPDNRRPVDFARRMRHMTLTEGWPSLVAHWQDGLIKFALTKRLLQLRHHHADLFQNGSYEPLTVDGPHAGHVIAFARTRGREHLIVAIGRHFAPLTGCGRTWPSAIRATPLGLRGRYEAVLGGSPYTAGARLSFDLNPIPVQIFRRI